MNNIINSPKGYDLLHNPFLNRGTAFTLTERTSNGIEGLLPPIVDTLELQIARIHLQLDSLDNDLQKYLVLSDLQTRNEVLFYAVIMADPATFMPLVYTPTVGEACQKFDHYFRAARGLYIPITAKGRIKEIMSNWPHQDIRFIVVTDGERILGLGDLGVNGMGIPVGKLALYTGVAGVPPHLTLPIMLDVGTNNKKYLQDPLYLGLHELRVRGTDYDEFIDEFVQAVQSLYPKCCIQWEDFANINAVPILERYREKICTYNDDIQGTAAMALAGISASLRITGQKLTEQRFLFMGAGSAGTGIAELISQAMVLEGLTIEEAQGRCWLFDVNGLLEKSRTDIASFQLAFTHTHTPCTSFVEAITSIKPTAILGVSGVPKLFNQQVIETMAKINFRPIIFPLSNPTSQSECTAEEAYRWSNGAVIFASGSPFAPVEINGNQFVPSQGNNVYIFPAMGMAVLVTEATLITQAMFIIAAQAVAEQVTQKQLDSGVIYPPQSQILETSLLTATKIATYIFDQGFARAQRPANIEQHIRSIAYQPKYLTLC
jgi:malate dehydrogenase (oxaloacetate-decarboxylating)(NADP+)